MPRDGDCVLLISFKSKTFFITPTNQIEQHAYLRRYDIIFGTPYILSKLCGVNGSNTFKLCKHRAVDYLFFLLVAFLPYEDPPTKISVADKVLQEWNSQRCTVYNNASFI